MEKKVFNAAESSLVVKNYVPIPDYQVVKKLEEITMKPPLVLKILSKDAVHKTEVNGVKVVHYPESLGMAFQDLMDEAKKHNLEVDGIMVQEFIKGVESIMGIKKDPVFGHMVLFGLGGIFAEAIADTSTRKCPITLKDADEMISSLRSSKVFHEFRGMKVNYRALKKSLVSLSKLPYKHPEIEELDINPFTVSGDDGFAVDVRIVSS